jgi:PhoPQ-activated pathogenicity-related protein
MAPMRTPKNGGRRNPARFAALILHVFLAPLAPLRVEAGALEDYLATRDDAYQWKVRSRGENGTCSVVELALTSQSWRSNTWQHPVQVVIPAAVRNPDFGFLFITGDGDGRDMLGLLRTVVDR